MPSKEPGDSELKRQYLRKAIEQYEFSPSAEYDKARMGSRAQQAGTLDFDYDQPERDVELSHRGSNVNGVWVSARVWVPSEWLESKKEPKR